MAMNRGKSGGSSHLPRELKDIMFSSLGQVLLG